MNWIQQNRKLASILGVMIVGGLGLVAWLLMAWSGFSSARAEWDSMSQRTTTMENSKVYPSAANVQSLDQKITDYRDKFFTLRKVLLDPKLQQPVTPMSETEFQAKVKERAKAIDQRAKELGVSLPKSFAVGVEEYSDTLPPNAEAAAELNVHLDVLEKFIMTLVEAKVTSLDELQRTRLAVEKTKGPAPAPAPVPAKQKRGVAAAPVATAEQVLDRYTIKCVFTTDQGPLQAVMNNLSNAAKTPDFLAVRLMRVENERTDAPTKEEIKFPQQNNPAPEPPAPPKTGDAKAPASNIIAPPRPQPPDARAIIGFENLKVYLEVDYIRFREPPSEEPVASKR